MFFVVVNHRPQLDAEIDPLDLERVRLALSASLQLAPVRDDKGSDTA